MRDGAIYYKLDLLTLTMAVDNLVFSIKKVHINVLCTKPSNGHTSLSTALVYVISSIHVPILIVTMAGTPPLIRLSVRPEYE